MTAPTVLLTGASGVVGSALLRELADTEVISLTHHKPITGQQLRGDVTRPWLGLHPADYRSLAARVDVVVHCAASVNFTASRTHLHNVNVRGTGHVLRFAEDATAGLVHGSTAFIARAGRGSLLDAYAESKATGETLVRTSGLPYAIARLSTVIGDSASGRTARLQAFHHVVGSALTGQLPFLPCAPGTRIDFVPQDTAAAALAALVRSERLQGEHWITAGDAALPMARLLDLCGEAAIARDSGTRIGDLGVRLFGTRLLEPDVFERIMTSVLDRAQPGAAPSVGRLAADVMTAFTDTEPFPTSIGTLPQGPAPITPDSLENALRHTLCYLLTLPQETWDLT
ncbi:SDR family oxidoreductase [Kitasatospora sp. NPDC096077]|uniref:SDR family oxidoreductase n=1 Tax=Kitasatospora sp. NPDC096077 TaxID=3155544 RepID=UPI0033197B15